MSTEQQTSWKSYAVVAGISAMIGFGAIYLIAGGGGNGPAQQSAAQSQPNSSAASANGATAASPGAQLNVGKMATFVFKDERMALPEYTFNGPDGKAMSFNDLKGKVVLLNLWATWCAPCRKEMPELDQLQAELGSDKFEVVAISVDRGSPAKSRAFLKEINANALKLYHDPTAQLGFSLKTIGMPSTLLVDAEGKEIGRLVGPAEWHSADAIRLIKNYLSEAEG